MIAFGVQPVPAGAAAGGDGHSAEDDAASILRRRADGEAIPSPWRKAGFSELALEHADR
jgi:hypothetical protein